MWREEYYRIWEYVGGEYYMGSVKKTCRSLEKKETDLLHYLHNMGSKSSAQKGVMTRAYKRNYAGNKRRAPSNGEFSLDD